MDNNVAVALELGNVTTKRGHRNNGFGTNMHTFTFFTAIRSIGKLVEGFFLRSLLSVG